MLFARVITGAVVLIVAGLAYGPSHAQSRQQRLDSTGQKFVDNIKDTCRQRYPDNEQDFRGCAAEQYDAMTEFFGKLFRYRDTKGMRSTEFKKGITCIDNASPAVREQRRKVAVERADWIKANDCYESALR